MSNTILQRCRCLIGILSPDVFQCPSGLCFLIRFVLGGVLMTVNPCSDSRSDGEDEITSRSWVVLGIKGRGVKFPNTECTWELIWAELGANPLGNGWEMRKTCWLQNYSKLPSRDWKVLISLCMFSEMLGAVSGCLYWGEKDCFVLEFYSVAYTKYQAPWRAGKELQTKNWSCHRQEWSGQKEI